MIVMTTSSSMSVKAAPSGATALASFSSSASRFGRRRMSVSSRLAAFSNPHTDWERRPTRGAPRLSQGSILRHLAAVAGPDELGAFFGQERDPVVGVDAEAVRDTVESPDGPVVVGVVAVHLAPHTVVHDPVGFRD